MNFLYAFTVGYFYRYLDNNTPALEEKLLEFLGWIKYHFVPNTEIFMASHLNDSIIIMKSCKMREPETKTEKTYKISRYIRKIQGLLILVLLVLLGIQIILPIE